METKNQSLAIPLPLPVRSGAGELMHILSTFPRPVWILFVGVFINKFGSFVMPFLALHLKDTGFSNSDAALAIGAYGAGNVLASLLGGFMADKVGRRKTIVISMVLAAISIVFLARAQQLWTLVLFTAIHALSAELYRPASSALLADLIPAGQRVTAFAAYRLAFNAGFAFGPATAGFLAESSYGWLFVGNAVAFLAFGAVAYFALPRDTAAHSQQASWKEAFLSIRGNRYFQQVLLSSLLIGIVFFQLTTTYPIHIKSIGFSALVYGLIISLNGVLVVLLELPITLYTRRLNPRRCVALGYVLTGCGMAINGFAGSIEMMVIAMIVFTIGEIVALPVSSAYIADLSPPDMRGRYMGMFGFTWSVSLIFSPTLGMELWGLHPLYLWMGCAVIGLLAAAVILFPIKNPPKSLTLQ